jgi:hypothetical protein
MGGRGGERGGEQTAGAVRRTKRETGGMQRTREGDTVRGTNSGYSVQDRTRDRRYMRRRRNRGRRTALRRPRSGQRWPPHPMGKMESDAKKKKKKKKKMMMMMMMMKMMKKKRRSGKSRRRRRGRSKRRKRRTR